jgi:hypothetical protein
MDLQLTREGERGVNSSSLMTPDCDVPSTLNHHYSLHSHYGMLSERDRGGFWWLSGAAEGHADRVLYPYIDSKMTRFFHEANLRK